MLKVAKDDRERCILLLLAGAGLRVSEMTQIKAEDIDFNKGYLHVQALNAKFNKPPNHNKSLNFFAGEKR